jgi:hypothetical protein
VSSQEALGTHAALQVLKVPATLTQLHMNMRLFIPAAVAAIFTIVMKQQSAYCKTAGDTRKPPYRAHKVMT